MRTIFFFFHGLIVKELNLVFWILKFNSFTEFVLKSYAQRVSADISITFNQRSLTASSVITVLLFSSSVVAGKPGSPATWFRAGHNAPG